MIEIHKKSYLPLKREHVDLHVPPHPGLFTLAVQLANGEYEPFYSTEWSAAR